jgi:protein gp37
MAENTAISWCDHTLNPWIGCTKVSPACDHCYAERDNGRRKWVEGWGPGVPRKRTSTSNWQLPRRWDRQYLEQLQDFEEGMRTLPPHHPRVFCASLADVFDNEVLQQWRDDLWKLIDETPNLRWILLTKRVGNVPKMLNLARGWPFPNAGLMATIVDQEEWDRDYHKLADLKKMYLIPWIGISAEPLLGSIYIGDARPDWIITGGESGSQRRALNMDHVRDLRDQCARNGVTFHHKQNGGFRGKDGGCLVDGVEHKHFPPALAA